MNLHSLLTRLAIWWLTRAGYTPIPPGMRRGLIDGLVIAPADSVHMVPIGWGVCQPGHKAVPHDWLAHRPRQRAADGRFVGAVS